MDNELLFQYEMIRLEGHVNMMDRAGVSQRAYANGLWELYDLTASQETYSNFLFNVYEPPSKDEYLDWLEGRFGPAQIKEGDG